jgi:hypothetical protein
MIQTVRQLVKQEPIGEFHYRCMPMGSLIDLWVSVPPAAIVRATLFSYDTRAVIDQSGDELESERRGSFIFSRIRVARCSEANDFHRALFVGTVLGTAIFKLDVTEFASRTIVIYADHLEDRNLLARGRTIG